MDESLRIITAKESGERIDALLARSVEDLSRSAAQHLIEEGRVTLDGLPLRKNYKVRAGDEFELLLPPPADVPLLPQEMALDVVFEDADVIVVNKPRGLVVHPAPGHPDGTLVNALLWHCGDSLSGIGGEKRPGIVHRIDKDTSGLLIVAKNDLAHQRLSAQLADRSLSRVYEAIVRGGFREDEGTVDRPIGRHPTDRKRMAVLASGRNAVTHWQVLCRYRDHTHIRCQLETGRTHQIRVHMASIGHPLLGDGAYGAPSPEKGLAGQCLHARCLKFVHPRSGEAIRLETELPPYFLEVLSKLGNPIE
ncbi:MAG: RluA family pseudouridine synthase [Oscillospiraceae bacterium]|nr:RluA family pseudouridine synthase [Oscillospiraceae bacterium]